MTAFRIAVCPVHDATLIVPLILALEAHRIADRQTFHAVSEVDIV